MNTQHYNQLLLGIKIFLNVLSFLFFIVIFGRVTLGLMILVSFLMLVVFNFQFEQVVILWTNIIRGYKKLINFIAHYLAGFITGLTTPQQ